MFEKMGVGKYYIYQPNGDQQFPDLLIINKNSKGIFGYPLELKRTNSTNTVTYNEGYPKENSIYIISFDEKTIIVPDSVLISDVQKNFANNQRAIISNMNRSLRISGKWNENCTENRLEVYFRPKFSEKLCMKKINKNQSDNDKKIIERLTNLFN